VGYQPVGGTGGHCHDRQRRVRAALGGEGAAVGDVEIGHRETAAVSVHDAVLLICGHPCPADQMRVAVDGDYLVGARRMQQVFHH
jgi:hypothetical protein